MFDLETALAAWRRSLSTNRTFSADDLDELERHVRDQVEALARRGLDEEEAFHRALREMGSYGAVEAEYRKVYWGKRRRRGEVLHELTWRGAMLKNYLKIAWRNVLREKGYAFVNIVGLAVGLACFILILLFVHEEVSYDRFHEKADRIYRAAVTVQLPNTPPLRVAIGSRPIAPTLRADYPEVEHAVRLYDWSPGITHNGRRFFHDDVWFADATCFDVFSFPLIKGDPATALRDPYTLVLTEAIETKYFGEESGVGQTLTLGDTLTFTITGVVADAPATSHFTFDVLASYATFEELQPISEDDWLGLEDFTYVLLHNNASATAFEAKIADLIMQNYGETLRTYGASASIALEPLTRIYLHSNRQEQIGPTGDIRYVYAFLAIATFVLLIACINFINLSTARSMKRAKEVGVRKAVGSSRMALIRQFLSESMLITAVALVLAIGLVYVALPFFNDLAGKNMSARALVQPGSLLGLIGLVLVVGVLAGGYPAFALSRFKPVEVLKGTFTSAARGVRMRQGLVVFQFTVSVVLIVGTLIVFQQLDFMQNQNLGFDKEQVLVLNAGRVSDRLERQYRTVKQELLKIPSIQEVSASNGIPGRSTLVQLVFTEYMDTNDGQRVTGVFTDQDYLETMGIDLVSGRGFSEDVETDVQDAVLLNEAAVNTLGWASPDEALGKRIHFGDEVWSTVVGVIKDYHQLSLRQHIEPEVMRIVPSSFTYVSVRFTSKEASDLLAQVEQTWQRLFPGYPFDYFLLDDDFNTQYQAEQRLTAMFGTFSFLAILIAGLGLFGLASFTTAQRTKEIGVRKVLGASVGSIVVLLSTEFFKLVAVATLVAMPIAYLAMQQWLEDFAYRIEVSLGIFLLTAGLVLLIALMTVSYQAIKAALADPVKSLRYE